MSFRCMPFKRTDGERSHMMTYVIDKEGEVMA